MAGRPMRNAMIAALTKRVNEINDDNPKMTALDYTIAWIESGRTLTRLVYDLDEEINGEHSMKSPLSRSMLLRYLLSLDPLAQEKLDAARTAGAHAMVEAGNEALEDSHDDKDAINAADKRLQAKERLAAVWNSEYRVSKNAGVTVNIGSLHLDALRKVNQERPMLPATATILLTDGEEK